MEGLVAGRPLLGHACILYCSCGIASPLQQLMRLQMEQVVLGHLVGLLGEHC